MSLESLKPDFFGWEMLYKSIEKVIVRKTDTLIALTHFVLLKHARFLCLGNGEDNTLSPNEVGKELLPAAWNHDPDKYALRYIWGHEVYVLLGYKTDDGFVISLLNELTQQISRITLDSEKLVDKIKGSIKDLLPDASIIAELIRRELIDPIRPRFTSDVATQTNPKDAEKMSDTEHPFTCFQQGISTIREFLNMQIGEPKPLYFKYNSQADPKL